MPVLSQKLGLKLSGDPGTHISDQCVSRMRYSKHLQQSTNDYWNVALLMLFRFVKQREIQRLLDCE